MTHRPGPTSTDHNIQAPSVRRPMRSVLPMYAHQEIIEDRIKRLLAEAEEHRRAARLIALRRARRRAEEAGLRLRRAMSALP